MKRSLIVPDIGEIPVQFHPLLTGAAVYDSSCSQAARVLFIDKEDGFFLKSAAPGSLRQEAELTAYFHGKGLSAQVLAYESGERDWLLTRALPGQDCLSPYYVADPVRLCDTTAYLLRQLHETDRSGCPVPDRTARRLEQARRNYETGNFDRSLFPDNWGFASAEEAMEELERNGRYLRTDCLLHGDYCLPNILLEDWRFSGFIDLAAGGVGDRHMDLHWGLWSLWFNLKTDRYRERFLDAYGTEAVEEDLLRTVAALEVFAP